MICTHRSYIYSVDKTFFISLDNFLLTKNPTKETTRDALNLAENTNRYKTRRLVLFYRVAILCSVEII